MENQQLIDLALKLGATKANMVKVADIKFRPDYRLLCERNACGSYDRCWMCPPEIGAVDDLIDELKQYDYALVYQTIADLEDSFDVEGMYAAGDAHNELANNIRDEFDQLGFAKTKHLGAGGCGICPKCGKMTNEACRFPDKAMSSLEAYGIAVSELASLAQMKYINGQDTVTYFGAAFFSL